MQNYRLEQFEGPLDLLLQMIKKEELDITEVALAVVADQFVAYIEQNPEITGQELADFLLVASQLLLLKSKMLLPDIEVEDDISTESLETQLKLYRKFVLAAERIQTKIQQKQFLYTQKKSKLEQKARFSPPVSLTKEDLTSSLRDVLKRLEPIVILPESVMEKTVTLHEKIIHIQQLLRSAKGVSFKTLLQQASSKTEQIVSFLALLELVKQQEVSVAQQNAFSDIVINKFDTV